jgi:hypothetical protein
MQTIYAVFPAWYEQHEPQVRSFSPGEPGETSRLAHANAALRRAARERKEPTHAC